MPGCIQVAGYGGPSPLFIAGRLFNLCTGFGRPVRLAVYLVPKPSGVDASITTTAASARV